MRLGEEKGGERKVERRERRERMERRRDRSAEGGGTRRERSGDGEDKVSNTVNTVK